MTGSSKCPKCGTEVFMPVKSWTMRPKNKRGSALFIAVYECPNRKCRYRWRVVEKVEVER